MKLSKVLSISILTVLLTGCSGFWPKETIVTYEKVVYPELPPVPPVSPLELIPCIPDRPRVWWEDPVVKNLTDCKKQVDENPEIVKSESFQRKCMEFRIDVDSNIIYGFDKEGQSCYAINREKIRYQLKKYQDRIDEINDQRKRWIERNAKNADRDQTK